ncbi:hypothetical protein DMENIID0001_014170 [Sergentomyia squamirostris]
MSIEPSGYDLEEGEIHEDDHQQVIEMEKNLVTAENNELKANKEPRVERAQNSGSTSAMDISSSGIHSGETFGADQDFQGNVWTSNCEDDDSKEHLDLILTSIKNWARFKELNFTYKRILDKKKSRDDSGIPENPDDGYEPAAKRAKSSESPDMTSSSRCEETPANEHDILGNLWASNCEEEDSKAHLDQIVTSIQSWVQCEVRCKEMKIMHQIIMLDEQKNRHHQQQIEEIIRAHENQVDDFTNAIQSLEASLQKKESEMKIIEDNHGQNVNNLKKSHEIEVSKLYGSVDRLEQEKKDTLEREQKAKEVIKSLEASLKEKVSEKPSSPAISEQEVNAMKASYKKEIGTLMFQSIEMKQAHDSAVLKLNKQIDQLKKEKKNILAREKTLVDDNNWYKQEVDKLQSSLSYSYSCNGYNGYYRNYGNYKYF